MAKPISKFEKLRNSALALWDETIFSSTQEVTRVHKFIHFWVLVGKSFVRNRCPIRASALSYTTLLALIPMLAVALSVTSSLLKNEGEERISQFIEKFVASVVPPGTNSPALRHGKRITPLPPLSATNQTAGIDSSTAAVTNALSVTNLNSGFVSPDSLTNLAIAGAESTSLPPPTNALAIVSSTNTAAILSDLADDPRVLNAQKNAAREINKFIQNTRSGTLGVTGMIILIFVAIQMLSRIEATFNDIWGVVRGRGWFLRIIMYWATLTLGPLLLAGALGWVGSSQVTAARGMVSGIPAFTSFVLPLVILWVAFAVFYKAVPNTKVHFSAALVGGMVSGTLWHLNNVFGFLYVSRLVTNSKIYGSLALVPVFMAGLYLSWFILLLGAQVAYAFQNRELYLQEKLAENVNQRGREFVAMRLMTSIGQRFQKGMPPATVQNMSKELGVPSRLVQQVLQTLVAAHLVIEVSGAEPAYTPARPLEEITAHHVLQAMRASQGQELITRDEPVRAEVYGEFARIQEAERQAASSISMLTLVHRAQARTDLTLPDRDDGKLQLKPALTPSSQFKPASETVAVSASEHPAPERREEPEEPVTENVAAFQTEPDHSDVARTIAEPLKDEERDFPL